MTTLDDAERGGPVAADRVGVGQPPRAPGDPLDRVLDHLRRHVRADAALILLVDRDRTVVEPAAAWYASPVLERVLAPLLRRPYDRRRPGLVEATLERGGPLLLPRLEDWEAAAVTAVPTGAADERAWETIRRASAAAAPIRTTLGRTLGAVAVLSLDEARPLGRAELDMVTVLADLAALARERGELLAAEADQRRQEVLLKRAAEGTSATLEPNAVERAVVAHAAQILDAQGALLSRVRPGSQRLAAVARHGDLERPVDAAALSEVVRARNATLHAGDPSMAHVPIELGPRLFGVLTVARADGRHFDRDELALAAKVARIAAAAIANAEAFQQERHLARTLIHGFVPEALPTVAGWELGVLYEPADEQPTGGDLYGAWQLPSGDVAVVIGDVVGKGVETAALSAMARFFIEAASWDREDPAAVLERVNAMLARRLPSERFVTAFFGLLGRRGLRYVNAGHLAPLVVRADGQLSETATGGLPLGIDEAAGYTVHRLELGPDDVLVGYTDGILEARRDGELLGDERLRDMLRDASAATREPEALTELLHDGVRAWARGLSDDAAIVALRRRGLTAVQDPPTDPTAA